MGLPGTPTTRRRPTESRKMPAILVRGRRRIAERCAAFSRLWTRLPEGRYCFPPWVVRDYHPRRLSRSVWAIVGEAPLNRESHHGHRTCLGRGRGRGRGGAYFPERLHHLHPQ